MKVPGLDAFQARAQRLGVYQGLPLDSDWGPGSEDAFDKVFAIAEAAKGIQRPLVPLLPPRYSWLLDLSPLPLIVHEGLKLLGTKEVAGTADSPVILQWAKDLGLSKAYSDDAIPWCGLFVAKVVSEARKPPVENPLWARNWLGWGVPVEEPGLGDVMVFKRGSGGHVAFYIGEDAEGYFHILGGNQSDAVNIMRKRKRPAREDGGLLGVRRAVYKVQPPTVRPYKVAAGGTIVTREA
jgi:uncharacterized protein (TIGR02594 family)